MATKVNGFETGGGDGDTIPSGASNADPDSFTVALGGSATATFTTSVPAHGSQCGALTAASSGDTAVLTMTGFTGSSLTCSVYLRMAALPSANVYLAKTRSDGISGQAVIGSDGKLRAYDKGGTLRWTATSALSTDTWYRVELSSTKGTATTDGRLQLAYYAGDSETATESYDSGAAVNTGTADMATIQLGWLSGSGTGTLRLDSWQGVESTPPVGPWVTDPLAASQTDDAGSTDSGYVLDSGLTLTLDDDAGAADDLSADGALGSPPPGGGNTAVLDEAKLSGGLTWLYPLQEQSGTVAGDTSGVPGRPRLTATHTGDAGDFSLGASGIMPEGVAARFEPALNDDTGAIEGWTLGSGDVSAYLGTEFGLWLQFAWSGSSVHLLTMGSVEGPRLDITATSSMVRATLTTASGSRRVLSLTTATADNQPHMLVLTASGNTLTLYVDTTDQNATTLPADMGRVHGLTLGGLTSTAAHQVAWVGYANAALTPARAADILLLGSGGSEASDARVARICRWVGVGADLVAEAGLSDVTYSNAGGAQALDLIAAVNTVEDGVFFPAGDGTLRQHSRGHRYGMPVTLALTAAQVSPDLAVQVDLTRVVNDLTITRPTGAMGRARDQASITAYGPRSQELSMLAATDDAAQDAAWWRVNRYSQPAPRIPSVSVNLLPMTAQEAAAVLGLEVGDRMQITDMPATTPGGTTVDLVVEGVDEQVSATAWQVTFATSPYWPVSVAYLDDDDTAALDTARLAY